MSASFALVNLAIIGIAEGHHNIPAIHQDLATARIGFAKIAQPLGLVACDLAQADLDFSLGNYDIAQPVFNQHLHTTQGTNAEVTTWCLERLYDISYAKQNLSLSFHYCIVYFAFAMQVHDYGAIHQALRRIGDVFLEQGDTVTAESVFVAALAGFTLMDIHRSRGDCMLRLGDLWNLQGKTEQAREMWRAAKPLFSRSSQAQDVQRCDERLGDQC